MRIADDYTISDFARFWHVVNDITSAGLRITCIKLSDTERRALERMSGQTGHCLGYPVEPRP